MTSNKLLLAILSAAVAVVFHIPAFGHSSRVTAYGVTEFTAAWQDIATTGDTIFYTNTHSGYGTLVLPFDFNYDDSLIKAGSPVTVGVNCAISLTTTPVPDFTALDSVNYPGLICIFSGDMDVAFPMQGNNYGYYKLDGAAPNRVLTIEYTNVKVTGTGGGGGHPGGLNPTSMQVKLYETTNVIEFVYHDHNNIFETDTVNGANGRVVWGAVGLNGLSTPSFVSKTYQKHIIQTPATDVRWTPNTASLVTNGEQEGFTLGKCYPNPSKGLVQIPFTLPNGSAIKLELTGTTGEKIETIYSGYMSAGDHTVPVSLSELPSGAYFYTLTSNGVKLTRQMVVVR